MPRYFTLAEARATLPVVGRAIHDAVQAKARYSEADKAIHDLGQRIMMMGGLNVDTNVAEAWNAQEISHEHPFSIEIDRTNPSTPQFRAQRRGRRINVTRLSLSCNSLI